MGRITARVLALFHAWDRPSQVAMILALALLLVVLLVYLLGPVELRQTSVIGCFGLIIVMQVIIMWANRGMVTAYTKAQRAYLAGDFAGAAAILEQARTDGKANMKMLTLLGNTLRQLGRLEESTVILEEALAIEPNHHFSLYGFGRTLLVKGSYAEAAMFIQQAVDSGAPDIVLLDLGEALFRAGDHHLARGTLERALMTNDEPQRSLMAVYLLYCMDGNPPPADLLQAGLPYWQAQAERFAHTPYGQALAEDVRSMQAIMREI
jgi:tetratricopeptide (TPR) repeat protein